MTSTAQLPTALESRFDGRLLTPGTAGYDDARSVWNAAIDHRPALIVQCATVDDVVAAVRLARENDFEIGVRCGGHNIAGLAVPPDGLMIDLTGLDRVHVDPVSKRARVQGGAMLGTLDRAAQRFGLATTAGNVSHTGVGGLTLGGGMGWLARQHGLACDNVLSCTVVTAEGQVVRASADEHPDLFWGLRGGGGNFGIVVEFEFRLHRVGTRALVAEFTFPLHQAADAVRGWRDLAEHAPRAATLAATISGDAVTLGYVWVGDPSEARALLPALRDLGTPAREEIRDVSYLHLQRRDDTVQGHRFRRYWKGHYLPDLTDDATTALLDRDPDDRLSPEITLQAHGGAIGDVDNDATAFSHRQIRFEYLASTKWTHPDEDAVRMAAARRAAAQLEPFAAGAYVNALSDEGAAGVGRAYSAAKLARLRAVKTDYDPGNVFHRNHNITPVHPSLTDTNPSQSQQVPKGIPMNASSATTSATAEPASEQRKTASGGPTWKSANARLWLVQAVLAAGYIAAAGPKLGHDPKMVANFADLGISATGMHAIGVLEIAGAIGLLVPRLVGAAATGLVALMIGAVILTAAHVGVHGAVAPIPFLALAGVVAWVRRDRTVGLAVTLARAIRRPAAAINRQRRRPLPPTGGLR